MKHDDFASIIVLCLSWNLSSVLLSYFTVIKLSVSAYLHLNSRSLETVDISNWYAKNQNVSYQTVRVYLIYEMQNPCAWVT